MSKYLRKRKVAIRNDIPLDLSLPKTLKDAVIKRDYASVKRLLQNGADPTQQDSQGLTALHFAVKDNRLFIANLILKKSTYIIMIKDNAGQTPLDYAVTFNRNSLQTLFKKKLNYIFSYRNVYTTCSFFKKFSVKVDKNPADPSQINYTIKN